jgi:peptidyl-prolyl cis-trans isomerase B (cyclophilin B)
MQRLFNLAKLRNYFMVKIHTNYGVITLTLFADKAPITVANFLDYVKEGFYDNTIFHRVIDGFMIQGGGFEPGMEQKESKATIQNEANNGLANNLGTVAMARTNEPHSATAQFFINVGDNSFLNFRSESGDGWGYCVFAEVSEGMDVVEKIKAVKTGNSGYHQDVPEEDVVIQKAEIVE